MGTPDDGLTFVARMTLADGRPATRETTNRRELLEWIKVHGDAGYTLVELTLTARAPALIPMLAAMTYGASRLDQSRAADGE